MSDPQGLRYSQIINLQSGVVASILFPAGATTTATVDVVCHVVRVSLDIRQIRLNPLFRIYHCGVFTNVKTGTNSITHPNLNLIYS